MTRTTRRVFLISSASAAGVLALGFRVPALAAGDAAPDEAAELNAFVRIDRDGSITLHVPCSEMGQGIHTGLAQVLAEELDADWQAIRVEVPQPAPVYDNAAFGMMLTVGSQSVRQYFEPLRRAGAAARAMLIEAAAQRWGVRAEDCTTEASRVLGPAGQMARFGELVGAAARLDPPEQPQLRAREHWRLIGQSQARLDTAAKSDGTAIFGSDVDLPGLLHASIRQCPVAGGALGEITNVADVRRMQGVRAVMPLAPDAVVVVADREFAALEGARTLEIEWREPPTTPLTQAQIDAAFRRAIEAESAVGTAELTGAPEEVLAATERVLEAEYELPFLAHACMEPPNCTARVDAEGCEIWVPTQGQSIARFAAAEAAGIDPSRVRIRTTLLGGGFGRKAQPDFIVQAVRTAASPEFRGRPVRLLWSREEDLQHDFYRPRTRHRFRAALAQEGSPQAWIHRIASPSIALSATPMPLEADVDPIVVEGATGLAYALPQRRIEYARCEVGVRVGFWRAVGWSANIFPIESFVDELAHAAATDPYAYRRRLLADRPRHLAVLDLAARSADWTTAAPSGRHRGIAFCEAEETLCAQVAELSVDPKSNGLRIHRIVCAVDCGTVVNPALVRDQIIGGTLFGLSATLFEVITTQHGRIEQGNFSDYRLLKFSETPEVEVHLVASAAPPSGVGEIATAGIGAAICNAIFSGTGRRVRSLPLVRQGFALA